ncbi:MAG: hypothetical protein HUT38_04680 [Candidatus Paceibacter sp.]|nr:hypothetical protein [Candidatus Paceibacter sp.]
MEELNETKNSIKNKGEEADFEKLPESPNKLKQKKTPEQEIDEINRQILETEKLIENEKKNLAEQRAKLGLPEKNEESASLVSYKEKINKLSAKKEELEKSGNRGNGNFNGGGVIADAAGEGRGEEEPEKEKQKEAPNENTEKIKPQEFNNFIEAAEGVARVLRERDSQGLDQLTDDPGRIAAAISSLRAAAGSQKPDIDGLKRSIGRIAEFVEGLGERQTRAGIKENPEMLGKLAYFLIKLGQEGHAAGGRIIKKENGAEIMPTIGRLEAALKDKKALIDKKMAFLKQYSGRRF